MLRLLPRPEGHPSMILASDDLVHLRFLACLCPFSVFTSMVLNLWSSITFPVRIELLISSNGVSMRPWTSVAFKALLFRKVLTRSVMSNSPEIFFLSKQLQ